MPSKQIRDVLATVRQFHHQLREYYENLTEDAHDERGKFLLDYLGRREKRMDRTLASYRNDIDRGTLDTWVQFASVEVFRSALLENPITPDMPVDEVVQRALQFDQMLIDLFRDMAEATSAAHVRELFTDLLQMEEESEHQLAKISLELR